MINKFGRVERLGQFQRHGIGIDAIGPAVAIKPERRHHGNNALGQQSLKHFHVHPLDLAREKMVLAVNDAQRMSDQGVAGGGAKIACAETLQDLVRQPVRRSQGEFQCRRVRHAAAVQIGRLNILFFRQDFNLRRRAMDQDDPNAQGAQHCDIQKNIGEILARDNRAIDADDEDLFPKARDVLQNGSQDQSVSLCCAFFNSTDSLNLG